MICSAICLVELLEVLVVLGACRGRLWWARSLKKKNANRSHGEQPSRVIGGHLLGQQVGQRRAGQDEEDQADADRHVEPARRGC